MVVDPYMIWVHMQQVFIEFFKKIPKIFVSCEKNKLIQKFNISSSDECSVNGFFSHNDHYMNEINLFTNKKGFQLKGLFHCTQIKIVI